MVSERMNNSVVMSKEAFSLLAVFSTLAALLLIAAWCFPLNTWMGVIYPDRNNPYVVRHIGSFDLNSDCREAAKDALTVLGVEAEGGYQCGYNCRYNASLVKWECEVVNRHAYKVRRPDQYSLGVN